MLESILSFFLGLFVLEIIAIIVLGIVGMVADWYEARNASPPPAPAKYLYEDVDIYREDVADQFRDKAEAQWESERQAALQTKPSNADILESILKGATAVPVGRKHVEFVGHEWIRYLTDSERAAIINYLRSSLEARNFKDVKVELEFVVFSEGYICVSFSW